MGTDCSRGSKQPLQRPRSEGILVGSKMGRPESWKWQRMRKRLKNQAGKAKMERPLVKQGPGCHAGNIGFWPN